MKKKKWVKLKIRKILIQKNRLTAGMCFLRGVEDCEGMNYASY